MLGWVCVPTLHCHPSHRSSPKVSGLAQGKQPHRHTCYPFHTAAASLLSPVWHARVPAPHHRGTPAATCPGLWNWRPSIHRIYAQPPALPRTPPWEPSFARLQMPSTFRYRGQQRGSPTESRWAGGSGEERLTQIQEHKLSEVMGGSRCPQMELEILLSHRIDVADAD